MSTTGKRSSLILTSDNYETIRKSSVEHEKLTFESNVQETLDEGVETYDKDDDNDFDSEISDNEVNIYFITLCDVHRLIINL